MFCICRILRGHNSECSLAWTQIELIHRRNYRQWLENWIGTRVCIGITFAVVKSDKQKYRQPDRKCSDTKDDARQKTLADFPWKAGSFCGWKTEEVP